MGLRLLHLNLHGLIRSNNLELGRDADTGGQTLYVLELVKGLAVRPEVDNVQLITRSIVDRRVSLDYSQERERISSNAEIIRLPFGPKRYIRKELFWPYLDDLADQIVEFLQNQQNLPDWIHAHYADAGYVGALVCRRLRIPLVFTGHSLGREKQRRLLAGGVDFKQIEENYSISRRIDSEELALAHANLIVTSTRQESEQQYARYESFKPEVASVIPPGVDSNRFHPINSEKEKQQVIKLLSPFLKNPSLPPLLSISRAVRRKNIPALVEAYGRSSILRERHNLVLVLGCREDLRQLEKQQRDVFHQIFELIDKYDLYGKVALPKQHKRETIPAIYRWAADLKGLFVNPALTEPFGLTLLEAAACGLPMIATDDGGPRDILTRCQNGKLVDVTDLESLQNEILQAGSDSGQWKSWSDNGLEAVSRYFSWDAHVCNYLALMQKSLKEYKLRDSKIGLKVEKNRLGQKLLLLDLDSSLEQLDNQTLSSLRTNLEENSPKTINQLGVITGRSIKAARYRYAQLHLPDPSVWICRAGTEIYYGSEDEQDPSWESSIIKDWDRAAVENALIDLKDYLVPQDSDQQSPYKVSYVLKDPGEGILSLVRKKLRKQSCAASPHVRCHWYLDVVPLRASRAEAIRYLILRWGLSLEAVLIVASQQGDAELIKGLTSAIVPAEYDSSLEALRKQQRVYFSSRSQSGVVDGLKHYRFILNK